MATLQKALAFDHEGKSKEALVHYEKGLAVLEWERDVRIRVDQLKRVLSKQIDTTWGCKSKNCKARIAVFNCGDCRKNCCSNCGYMCYVCKNSVCNEDLMQTSLGIKCKRHYVLEQMTLKLKIN